VTTVLWLLLA